MTDWQPIETAPKGDIVLLGWPDMVYPGYWMDTPVSNYWGLTGWFLLDDDVLTGKPSFPTHWMPLPDPPSPKAEEQQ